MKKATVSIARSGPVITKSMFSGYDLCLNSYVGCEFGCSYCYVRFMVKDDEREWGEFVRVREHITSKLPKELDKGFFKIEDGHLKEMDDSGLPLLNPNGKQRKKTLYKHLPISEARLVMGTMTDPYQPAEKKYRITQNALRIIVNHPNKFKKVGIFTRSPLVLNDLDLICQLPNARVHFTVTPYPHDVLRAIEHYSPVTERRWQVIKELKEAGLRVHVNVSPIIPILSDGFEEEFVQKLVELQVDEYFVDPMQTYSDSWIAFKAAAAGTDFSCIEAIMLNKDKYLDWKMDFFRRWNICRERVQHLAPNQLPIWSDHERKIWVNMLTGQQMNKRSYND